MFGNSAEEEDLEATSTDALQVAQRGQRRRQRQDVHHRWRGRAEFRQENSLGV